MKKVLYIHHGDINGGAPRSLRYLIERLNKNDYQPVVVCRGDVGAAAFFENTGSRVIVEHSIRPFHGSAVSGICFKQIIYNFVYALPTYFAAKRIIKIEKPDVLHLNSTCLFMCAVAAKVIDKHIRVICHVREPLLPNIWGSILKVMCNKFVDHFVAIDSFDGHSVDSAMQKTSVVYNFVDFDTYNSNNNSKILHDELNIPDEDIIYIMLYRISPENGICEAINLWKDNIKDVHAHLVIIGEIEGREVEYTEKCHQSSANASNIHILPFREDVPRVIASADVVLCTFTQPHFARVIIEGAAMGKPAISKDIEGPQELIVDGVTGFLCCDDKQMIERILQLIRDKKLRLKMGDEAENRAKELFNAEINVKSTIALYSDEV